MTLQSQRRQLERKYVNRELSIDEAIELGRLRVLAKQSDEGNEVTPVASRTSTPTEYRLYGHYQDGEVYCIDCNVFTLEGLKRRARKLSKQSIIYGTVHVVRDVGPDVKHFPGIMGRYLVVRF